ncbi:DNA translocase FtsK [Azospirillum sp.]|uniref:DNA translocase FtsK n=1 Tax=Azospirillum sp. TaxID=34012 RepID=UPI002D4E9107|nr:DNA translocase FtsK 4TM domain-containing protein [Azospirillum sp.]HYD69045.1 DNA translocase FtsK 4TM domain-containing protein [Azospirillum sp.]
MARSPNASTSGSQGGGRAARASGRSERPPLLSPKARAFVVARARELGGFVLGCVGMLLFIVLGSYSSTDPSWNTATVGKTHNLLGVPGAYLADVLVQTLGWAAWLLAFVPIGWGLRLATQKNVRHPLIRLVLALWGVLLAAVAFAGYFPVEGEALYGHPGGSAGVLLLYWTSDLLFSGGGRATVATGAAVMAGGVLFVAFGMSIREWLGSVRNALRLIGAAGRFAGRGAMLAGRHSLTAAKAAQAAAGDMMRREPSFETGGPAPEAPRDELRAPRRDPDDAPSFTAKPAERAAQRGDDEPPARAVPVVTPPKAKAEAPRKADPRQPTLHLDPDAEGYELPPLDLLQLPIPSGRSEQLDEAALRRNAEELERVLADFGVKGEVQKVHPGPVVTLYELEPAPGTKSSRVIGLADDIARSMSAVSVRVAVVPGRNVIGIEMPNARRETVLLREIFAAEAFDRNQGKLVLALGKDIGGQPVCADLARFPHLLVAGTTGSGKSVAINTMILSLLYRLAPERCRFIMIDPKMLELSVYEGIPHLLTPVVTDPKKAVVALKWTVREMEDRYRNMSKLGVRNIEGYNARLREARTNGESLTRRVQTGFDPDTGKPIFEEQPLDLKELPYIVVIVDEMADLMLVAGKDIEAAIQRLAQMARAAGIHLIMATQRPSVDVITGTIKANFPTRISFQVTSKIDSRTILGEQGAEQLLGQGDMLYMAGGGRITRVHGPFVSDNEVEHIVKFLKAQGEPNYVDAITEEDEEGGGFEEDGASGGGNGGTGDEMYDKAVAIVCRERKASTSFIQRQLRIGYNSAARLIERMEQEGVVSKPNHSGKREVLARNIEE